MKCSVLDLHSSKDAISICHQENANYAVLLNLTEPGTVPNQFHHRSRRQRDDGLSDPVKTGIIRVLAVRQQTFAGEVGTMHRDGQLCQD